jgi:hypothetical protein
MKKTSRILIFISLILPCLLMAADGSLESFSAVSNGKTVNIEWKTTNEQNIVRFEIERATQGQAYKSIYSINANGYASAYKYTDDDALTRKSETEATVETKNIFDYRVKVVYADNSYIYSSTQSVSFDISVIRRTWGMIKEMFR